MPILTIDGLQGYVPRLSPKGQSIYLSQDEWRYLLLHGSRKSTKSNTAQNLLISHCWENDGAVAAIVVQGLRSSVGSGCWEDITGDYGILNRDWFKGDIGCQWAEKGEPRLMSDTKMRLCKIRNRHGGTSEIQLHTLQHASKVEGFKDSQWSFLYLVEADRWDDPEVFHALIQQLRGQRVPFEKRRVVVDCNPPREGEDHWLHKLFIRNKHGQKPRDVNPEFMEVNFCLDDNPFISDAEKKEIYNANAADAVNLARNYHGLWVKSREGTAFGDQFRESMHVVGDVSDVEEVNHRILMPPIGTHEFPTGWDLGDAMNHAAVLGAKTYRANGQPVVYILDELVKIGTNSSIEDFTIDWMKLHKRWSAIMKHRGAPELSWSWWSDSTNLRYIAAAGGSAASGVYQFSGGVIQLDGVARGHGSVDARCQALRRALFANQIFVSASCHHVIEMLKKLRYPVDNDDPLKHVFDAVTYMLIRELPYHSHEEEADNSEVVPIEF